MTDTGTGYGTRDDSDDDSDEMPVFMPGADTPETTAHIMAALGSHPSVLTRSTNPASTTNRQWYSGHPRCAGTVGDGLSCDEHPFFTSLEGGPGASLQLVPGWEQNLQGGRLFAFYSACGITVGRQYRVEPSPSSPVTTHRC